MSLFPKSKTVLTNKKNIIMKKSQKILLGAFIFHLFLILFLIMFAKTQINKYTEKLSGQIISTEKVMPEFSEISIEGGFNVKLVNGNSHTINLETDETLEKHIKVLVENNCLIIKSDLKKFGQIGIVTINKTHLNKIELLAGANLSTIDSIQSKKLKIDIVAGSQAHIKGRFETLNSIVSAGSTLEIEGYAQNSKISVIAGSSLDAGSFICDSLSIDVKAGSKANVHVLNHLEAEALAGSKIRYKGQPHISKNLTAAGGSIKNH